MRKLSELKHENHYAFCPKCLEVFEDDVLAVITARCTCGSWMVARNLTKEEAEGKANWLRNIREKEEQANVNQAAS